MKGKNIYRAITQFRDIHTSRTNAYSKSLFRFSYFNFILRILFISTPRYRNYVPEYLIAEQQVIKTKAGPWIMNRVNFDWQAVLTNLNERGFLVRYAQVFLYYKKSQLIRLNSVNFCEFGAKKLSKTTYSESTNIKLLMNPPKAREEQS